MVKQEAVVIDGKAYGYVEADKETRRFRFRSIVGEKWLTDEVMAVVDRMLAERNGAEKKEPKKRKKVVKHEE